MYCLASTFSFNVWLLIHTRHKCPPQVWYHCWIIRRHWRVICNRSRATTQRIWHHIFIQNLKTLDLRVLSLICYLTFTFLSNAKLLTHTYHTTISPQVWIHSCIWAPFEWKFFHPHTLAPLCCCINGTCCLNANVDDFRHNKSVYLITINFDIIVESWEES